MPSRRQEPDRPHDTPLAARLRADREAAGLTQKLVAQALDIDSTQLSGWENGSYKPLAKRLLQLADLYETSVESYIELASVSPSSGKAAERSRRYRQQLETRGAAASDRDAAGNVEAAVEELGPTVDRTGTRRRRRRGPRT